MAKRLTQKMEKFCVLLFETGDPRQSAIGAGYSEKSASTIASLNRDKPVIQRRLEALNKMAEESSRSTRLEREQRLTVFEREDIVNDKGVLLRTSNINAIAEHNRMDGIYTEIPADRRGDTYIGRVIINSNGHGENKPFKEIIEGEVVSDNGN